MEKAGSPDRTKRLAEALRSNLARRKARERKSAEEGAETEPSAEAEDDQT